jgi:hypothetical protein
MTTTTCRDCGEPATHEYLDAYGPGQNMPVCGPDGLYYGLQGETVRPLPLTPEQAAQAHNARRASAFRYVRLTAARRAQGLPPLPETPPF